MSLSTARRSSTSAASSPASTRLASGANTAPSPPSPRSSSRTESTSSRSTSRATASVARAKTSSATRANPTNRSLMNYSRLVIATTLLARAGIGSADPNDTAESAFARGQAALKAGRIHQACDAYETSDKLAARIETEQSLASCYEQDGKPMAAARLYRSLADKDGNADRRKTSLAKADKLEAKAPRLRFEINPMPAGLIVKVDGAEVSSTADVPVDVGPHEVVATAP